jgi:hypothetical protein
MGEMIDHSPSGGWRFQEHLIHPWCIFAFVQLRHSPDTYQSVRPAAQHELLE